MAQQETTFPTETNAINANSIRSVPTQSSLEISARAHAISNDRSHLHANRNNRVNMASLSLSARTNTNTTATTTPSYNNEVTAFSPSSQVINHNSKQQNRGSTNILNGMKSATSTSSARTTTTVSAQMGPISSISQSLPSPQTPIKNDNEMHTNITKSNTNTMKHVLFANNVSQSDRIATLARIDTKTSEIGFESNNSNTNNNNKILRKKNEINITNNNNINNSKRNSKTSVISPESLKSDNTNTPSTATITNTNTNTNTQLLDGEPTQEFHDYTIVPHPLSHSMSPQVGNTQLQLQTSSINSNNNNNNNNTINSPTIENTANTINTVNTINTSLFNDLIDNDDEENDTNDRNELHYNKSNRSSRNVSLRSNVTVTAITGTKGRIRFNENIESNESDDNNNNRRKMRRCISATSSNNTLVPIHYGKGKSGTNHSVSSLKIPLPVLYLIFVFVSLYFLCFVLFGFCCFLSLFFFFLCF